MKTARIAVLGIAVVAGGAAAYVASHGSDPKPPAPTLAATNMVKVLVAAKDINVGTALGAADLRWQDWPAGAVSTVYITDKTEPNAATDWVGAVARAPFVADEPLRAQKLVKANGSGFMSAILPAGMRAVATKIGVDTAAGGFILPNDHVDVILTRRNADARENGGDTFTSETILKNVRILAIDQTVEDQNGQKVITGSTATLELTPAQTEVLALGKEMGQLSLSLRPLAEASALAGSGPETAEDAMGQGRGGLTVVRYGVSTNVVNR